MYIGYALFFLLVGGFEAILMRIQLAIPNNHFVSPEVFNGLFTMHGTTMVFFVGMPILFGFGNYLVPLMIGARDMAFPRLNAFSFWISAFGGILLYYSYIGGSGLYGAGSAPDVGWFAYAPLTARVFSPGHSTDYWTLSLLLTGDRNNRYGPQYHRDDHQHAVSGHEDEPVTPASMVIPCDLRSGLDGDRPPDGGADHVDARSLYRVSLLRYAGGRLCCTVDAFLLDLWTSGSLHPGASGICVRE